MKLRNPLLLKLAGFLAAWVIRLWMGTLRCRIAVIKNPDDSGGEFDSTRRQGIFGVWHESLLLPTLFRGRVYVLISQHADGEFIARACQYMRYGVIRGSSTRGGTQAMLQLLTVSKELAHILVTPDGPRGPRRRVHVGMVFLASLTGLPIIPCGVAYDRAWRAPSWDRFAVPIPWSKGYGVVGPPVYIPPRLKRKEMEVYRQLVEQRMLEMTALAERWATEKIRPVDAESLTEDSQQSLSA